MTTPDHDLTLTHKGDTLYIKISNYTPAVPATHWEPPEPEDYDWEAYLEDGTPVHSDDPGREDLEDTIFDAVATRPQDID